MKKSQFGFEYSWEDLRPVRPLFVTVLIAQLIGAAVGLGTAHPPSWYDSMCAGAALATFPGFLLGLPVQMGARAEALGENRVMVRGLGMVALMLSAVGLMVVAQAR